MTIRSDKRGLVFAVAIGMSIITLPANATVILGGSNCGTTGLTTTGTATGQVLIGCAATGSLEVNASGLGNGLTTANANGTGSISLIGGFGAAGDGGIVVDGDGSGGSAILNSNRGIELGTSGGTGSLTVQNGGLVQITLDDNGLNIGNSDSIGVVTVDGPNSVLASKRRINVGTFNGSSGTLTVSNGGLVQIIGTTDNSIFTGGATDSTGTITVTGSGSTLATAGVAIGNGVLTSGGSLTVEDGGTVTVVELVGQNSPGLSAGGDILSPITVTGAGSNIQVDPITTGFFAGREVNIGGFGDGALVIDDSGSVEAGGCNVNVSGGLFGTSTGSPGVLTVSNGGSLTADMVTVYANGTLNGNGTITADVTVNGGTVAPGNSPGTLTIDGSYSQDIDGRLVIEIAGLTFADFDRLIVLGPAAFEAGTTIDLTFVDGFAPSTGDQIDFLVADTFPDDMSLVNFNIVGLLPGFQFDVFFPDTGVFSVMALNDGVSTTADSDGDGEPDSTDNCTLTANADQRDTDGDLIGNACDADIDNNCIVNFLDSFVYRDNFFSPGDLDTDNNGDNFTNFLDLMVLSNQFFGPPGPSAAGCDAQP